MLCAFVPFLWRNFYLILCDYIVIWVVHWQDPLEGTKTVAGFESSSDSGQREICQPPPRNKSILSALFPRNKTLKPKRLVVSWCFRWHPLVSSHWALSVECYGAGHHQSPCLSTHCSVFVFDVWYLSAIGIFSWLLPQQCLRGFVLLLRLLPVFGSSKRWALAQIVVNQISQIHLNRGLWWKHEELNWSCWVKCWCRTCRHWCFPCLKCVRKTNVDSPYINISLLPGRVKWGSSSMAMSRVSASK